MQRHVEMMLGVWYEGLLCRNAIEHFDLARPSPKRTQQTLRRGLRAYGWRA